MLIFRGIAAHGSRVIGVHPTISHMIQVGSAQHAQLDMRSQEKWPWIFLSSWVILRFHVMIF